MKKILKAIVIIISLIFVCVILGLAVISKSSKIKDPRVGLNALIKIEKSNKSVELISEEPLRYIAKSQKDFEDYMKNKGYTIEQAGRSFCFTNGDESIALGMEGFLGYKIFSDEY